MSMIFVRRLGQNYAFVVVAAIFFALLVSAGSRGAPGVLILPLEDAFGWTRTQISFAAASGIFLYGLVGPFAVALMDRIGIRKTLMGALALLSMSMALSLFISEPWHLLLTVGVMAGLASGCMAVTLGAYTVNRWFAAHRGLAMGVLTSATATGTLIFVPGMAALASAGGWEYVVTAVAIVPALLIPVIYFFVPERPSAVGLRRYGATEADAAPQPSAEGPLQTAISALRMAVRTRVFWYLFATFFICGFTTNGLVGTHLIALCGDNGIPEIQAAGLLAMMGVFDLIGTTLSGWLTDRFDPRKLLFVYYSLRGLSLIYLPFSDFSLYSLTIFAVFYGLDWIATVPPTLRLTNEAFGDRKGPIIFGWIVAGHQLGAASAAFFAGTMRSAQGDYLMAFVIAGATGLIAAFIALYIRPGKAPLEPA